MAHTAKRRESLSHIVTHTAARGTGPYRVVEVGVYMGDGAELMIQGAMAAGRRMVRYFGFDLFELSTEEARKAERIVAAEHLAKKNKPLKPLSRREVEERLRATGAVVELFAGRSKDTLKAFAEKVGPDWFADLIFLDASHLPENIAADWASVSRLIGPETVCVLDDHIEEREDFGCKKLVDELQQDPAWKVKLLEPADRFAPVNSTVRCVEVRRS